MITHLKPIDFKILSLTTIATPHRGESLLEAFKSIMLIRSRLCSSGLCSASDWRCACAIQLQGPLLTGSFADDRLVQLYYLLERIRIESGAFSQLTREYMEKIFNPSTPNIDDVRYVFDEGSACIRLMSQVLFLWGSNGTKTLVGIPLVPPSSATN
jgi:triacylglycerol lipase